MVVGVCVSCAELFEGQRICPRCGAKVTRARQDVLAWEKARQQLRIAAWLKDGVIDGDLADRLRAHARIEHDAARVDAPQAEPEPNLVERGADGLVTGAS